MNIKILFQYHNNMYDTFQALRKLGDVQFLSYRVSKLPPDIPNIKPKLFGRRPFIAYNPFHLCTLLKDTDVLIVKHLNDPINIIPYVICLLRGITCVVIAQQIRKYEGLWKIPFIMYSYLLRFIGIRVLATTKRSFLLLKPLIPKTVYSHACIDINKFCSQTSHGANNTSLTILCVAKYQIRKNLETLIKAFRRLVTSYPAIALKLTIVGSIGLQKAYRTEYDRLKNVVKKLNLEQHVFLISDVDHSHIASIYKNSDVFVLPAAREPLGYSVVEAMACGLPVIVSSDAGSSSYVTPEKNGYIVDQPSEQAIVDAVKKFFTSSGYVNREKLNSFGQSSRLAIEKNHSPDCFISLFKELITS